jgi:hypothetical protein
MEINWNYNASSEQLTATHNGSEAIVSSRAPLPIWKAGQTRDPWIHWARLCKGGYQDCTPLVVRNGPVVAKNGYWVAKNKPAAASFPVEKGDSITAVSDGADDDGDGIAGIENGDYYVVIDGPGGVLLTAGIELRNSRVVQRSS